MPTPSEVVDSLKKELQTLPEPPVRHFSRAEWEDLGSRLENFHSIFSTFWEIGKPNFTYDLPTAGVYFDKIGEVVDFNINPDFWDTLDDNQKLFVICHEVTHVLFYHGFRINGLKTQQELRTANLALDITVNHFLTDNLGFDRDSIDPPTKENPKGKYCWIDTVFPEESKRPIVGQAFEYYYTLIKKEIEKNPNGSAAQMDSLDDHSQLDSFANKGFEKMMQDSIDATAQAGMDATPKIKEQAQKELDAEEMKNGKQPGGKLAGINAGNSWVTAKVVKVIPKRKWETVIKNWAAKYLEEKVSEQWQKDHRRLVNMPKDFMIPAEHEIEEYEKKRIPVWFFQDTSGSCAHLADRFFAAAMSLPEDRFIVKMHCFDTSVYETDLKSKKLYGFGGTSFTCIEEYIKRYTTQHKETYPDACFIITDGYGDVVNPKHPNRWYWFLSENYKQCIPKDSKTYELKDFE